MLMKATAVDRSFAITPNAEIGSPAAKSAMVARRARVPDQPLQQHGHRENTQSMLNLRV
jgi:hypothetical protein